MDILAYSAVELAQAIKAGETTAVEAMKAVLDRIDASEESIHAYVTIDREAALAKAEAVQKQIEAGELTDAFSRCSCSNQGQYVYRRRSDNLFFQDIGQFYPDFYRRSSEESGKGRCSDDW